MKRANEEPKKFRRPLQLGEVQSFAASKTALKCNAELGDRLFAIEAHTAPVRGLLKTVYSVQRSPFSSSLVTSTPRPINETSVNPINETNVSCHHPTRDAILTDAPTPCNHDQAQVNQP